VLSAYLSGFAAEHYDFNRKTLQFVAAGNYTEKQFYSFEYQDQTYILRIVKAPADRIVRTRAEMDWLCYLAGKGISASRPLRTRKGELAILAEEDGKTYILAAYTKAEGRPFDVSDPNFWGAKIFYNWGKIMGDMHRVTKDYVPEDETVMQDDFADIISGNVEAFPSVRKAADELIAEIAALPKDGDSYGLVHSDLGPTNFLIDGARINVFDFDDCCYTWFARDIGAALTFGLWFGRYNDAGHDFANDLFTYFLAGYRSANHLTDFWLSKIPLFLRLYQIAGFAYTNPRENPDDASQREQIRNIEDKVLFAGCTVDFSMFVYH